MGKRFLHSTLCACMCVGVCVHAYLYTSAPFVGLRCAPHRVRLSLTSVFSRRGSRPSIFLAYIPASVWPGGGVESVRVWVVRHGRKKRGNKREYTPSTVYTIYSILSLSLSLSLSRQKGKKRRSRRRRRKTRGTRGACALADVVKLYRTRTDETCSLKVF